jgi:N-acetylglutamate synthase-like GNAT family acetyltransferase
MVGYMSLEEQVDKDFSLARRKALLKRIGDRLRRRDAASDGLLCFDYLRKIPGALGRVYRGARTVPLGQIGGSVGRCSEFDRDFMPAKARVKERWKRIARAFHRGEELPAVSLYKVGGFYFVLDGHHRVSVACYHGVEWIDAEVTEFHAPSLVELRRTGTIEQPRGHRRPDESPEREDPNRARDRDPQERIEVRWALREDEAQIAELLELNGMPQRVATEERFMVAERNGRVVAALQYETETKKLVLGLLVVDPWAGEPVLAKSLYSKAHALAREMGVREVIVPANRYGDYPYKAGYRLPYHLARPSSFLLDRVRSPPSWRTVASPVYRPPLLQKSKDTVGLFAERVGMGRRSRFTQAPDTIEGSFRGYAGINQHYRLKTRLFEANNTLPIPNSRQLVRRYASCAHAPG